MKTNLFGKTVDELTAIVGELKAPAFSGKQIAEWIYSKSVFSFLKMTNLPMSLREKCNRFFIVEPLLPQKVQNSADGTKKYLFQVEEGKFVEAAYIPEKSRATLCISSQVGCKMRCSFCMTAKQGLKGNLVSGQILSQYATMPEKDRITNLVFMGMGEPLDNVENLLHALELLTLEKGYGFSPKKITVSTIGLIPEMEQFLEKSDCHLAISMHSAISEVRAKLVPLENKYPIRKIVEFLRKQDLRKSRRVSFEYIMFAGVNDRPEDVQAISKLLAGMRCRINLIRYHTIPYAKLQGSGEQGIQKFKAALEQKGFTTTIRASRGQDIDAACGLLSTRELMKG